MSKVALLSYYFYHNYGTCLQAYALFHYLSKNGVDCEYLNFGQCRCEDGIKYRISFFNKIKNILKKAKYFKYSKAISSNNNCFDSFRKKNVKETREYSFTELSSIENNYDKFILGSDQTLNPDCIGADYYARLLLNFVNEDKKKNSYASSLGKTLLTSEQIANLRKLLSSYNKIAVREQASAEMLTKLLGKNVVCVLDPTFLLSKEEWLSLANPLYFVKHQKYVFCYLLGAKKNIVLFAKKIAKEKGLKLVLYTNQNNLLHYGDCLLKNCGPFEFVKTIAKAQYVVTDSFHGTILSINCNVNFYAFIKRNGDINHGDNSRINDFLKSIGLECRLQNDDNPSLLSDIDYTSVNKKIMEMKKFSIDYLNSLLI